jgi:hypothetical protein
MGAGFSRRLFLGGMASLAVATTVKTATAVPTLWGDGVHDDAPALNALFRGDPIRVLNGRVIEGARPAVVDAKLLLGSTLLIDRVEDFLLVRSTLRAMPGFDGRSMVEIRSGNPGLLSDLYIDATHVPGVGFPWFGDDHDGALRVGSMPRGHHPQRFTGGYGCGADVNHKSSGEI